MTGFVDPEAMLLPFIRAYAPGVTVATKVPAKRPATFVRAWVSGGSAVNRVLEEVFITVDVWAPSTTAAAALAEAIRHGFLNYASTMPLVRGVDEVARPYSNPDQASDRYRATYGLMVRATR